MYKKLLFDLDDTLVDDDENRKYAFRKILEEKNILVSKKIINDFLLFDSKFWSDRAEGKIKDPYEFKNKEERTKWIRAYRFVLFFKDITLEEGIDINNKYIEYLKECVVPVKNAIEVLEYLYNKNYDIYIITNSPIKIVDSKLTKSGLKKYISDVYTAEEVGHMKPHEIFFNSIFNKIGYDKENMLIIGDKLNQDIAGAIYNNIDSCWFNKNKIINNTLFIPAYEIDDLIKLKDIL